MTHYILSNEERRADMELTKIGFNWVACDSVLKVFPDNGNSGYFAPKNKLIMSGAHSSSGVL